MRTHSVETHKVDLLRTDDGTTVLIRPEDERGRSVAPGGRIDGVVVFRLWCGGDDAHCDPDGWCEHTRALAEAQKDVEGRRIELVPRRRRLPLHVRISNPGRSFTVQGPGYGMHGARVSPTSIELSVPAPQMALDQDEAEALLEELAGLLGFRVERLPL